MKRCEPAAEHGHHLNQKERGSETAGTRLSPGLLAANETDINVPPVCVHVGARLNPRCCFSLFLFTVNVARRN